MSADSSSVSEAETLIGHLGRTRVFNWSKSPFRWVRRRGQEAGVDLVRPRVSKCVSWYCLWLVNMTRYRPLIGRVWPISSHYFQSESDTSLEHCDKAPDPAVFFLTFLQSTNVTSITILHPVKVMPGVGFWSQTIMSLSQWGNNQPLTEIMCHARTIFTNFNH